MPIIEVSEAEGRLLQELRRLAETIQYGTVQVVIRDGKPVSLAGNCSVRSVLNKPVDNPE